MVYLGKSCYANNSTIVILVNTLKSHYVEAVGEGLFCNSPYILYSAGPESTAFIYHSIYIEAHQRTRDSISLFHAKINQHRLACSSAKSLLIELTVGRWKRPMTACDRKGRGRLTRPLEFVTEMDSLGDAP